MVNPGERSIDCRHLRSPGLLVHPEKVRLFKKKHPWFRRRGYRHFDNPIGFATARKIVTSPHRVETHSFYPLIDFNATSIKVKREASTNQLKKIPKIRPICYAAHIDSHIYSYYAYMLAKRYEQAVHENGLDTCVIAFRSLKKSNIEFAADVFDEIKRRDNCHVICLDIKGFFDNLDHETLKNSWANILGQEKLPGDHYAVFRSLTNHAKVGKTELYALLDISIHNPGGNSKRLCSVEDFREKVRKAKIIKRQTGTKGIPQGSPISALLSNIYMLAFDIVINSYVQKCGGRYFRYCDDMLLIVPAEEKNQALNLAEAEIKKLLLIIQSEKTEQRDFAVVAGKLQSSKPLQYLGFLFDGQRILLRSASLARYSDRMRRGIRLAKATMKKKNEVRTANGDAAKALFKRKIYKRYTCVGRRNFITYGYRAAQMMQSKSIKKQLRCLWLRVQKEILK
ncbi:antiviral reverse transcriptase Drt2 [Collimonas arenae]|uniref:antiviral reverse transcriptase Drt2 n=1 Tax=Collimonas arenae TaxID=279058 RepID=UPI0020A056DE|nr:antiviral reverse transcriptase Drt2 [Collimonas arenae]